MFSTSIYAENDIASEIASADSLKSLLSKATTLGDEVSLLYELTTCYRDEPEERDYSLKLFEKTLQTDSIDLRESAVSTLVRYYYNQGITDSLVYWNEQMKQIAKERGFYSDRYFVICNVACQYQIWYDLNQNDGANEAIRLYNLAKEVNSDVGKYSSCETMGLAYYLMGKDSISVTYYEKGISIALNVKPLNISIIQSMHEALLEAVIRLKRTDSVKKYLEQYEQITDEIVAGKYGVRKFPINRCRWLSDCFRIEYNILIDDLAKAKSYLAKGYVFSSSVQDIYVEFRYHLACVHFYVAMGNYRMALSHMEDVLKFGDSIDIFELKGHILQKMGRNMEAAECYKNAVEMSKVQFDQSFMYQMTQLSHMYEINQETIAHNEEVLRRKKLQNIFILCVFFFVLVILLLVFIYSMRVRRMNNKIRIECDRLQESEARLSIAKDKAEESDRLKSHFLANMSHEIRTPLNAIVGFSQLLSNPDPQLTTEERNNFSDTIVNNSELLLNLINDILDISKLEADMYSIVYNEYDINKCCNVSISSVQHRLHPNVKMVFEPQYDHYILSTDHLRLEQVLINLLTNAAKFTTEGQITLTYEVNVDKGYVQFSVTDTGCGIPKEKQAVVFKRFEKLNEYVQGSGLGLYICSLIVKKFGGYIDIDSKYTDGARFVFTHLL